MEAYLKTNPPAGSGWALAHNPALAGGGIVERVDDYCATSYVYCRRPQSVPRLDIAAAVADIGRRDYEQPTAIETMMAGMLA